MISNTFPSIREPPHETNKSKLGVTSYTQDENENISHMLSKTQRSRLSLVLQEEQESLLHWTQIREKLTIEIQNSNKEATTAEIAEAVVSTQSTGNTVHATHEPKFGRESINRLTRASSAPHVKKKENMPKGEEDYHRLAPQLELERKLMELRTDPQKRAELAERIANYKAERVAHTPGHKNFHLENKRNVTAYYPDNYLNTIYHRSIQHDMHMHEVKTKRLEMEDVSLKRRLEIVYKKKFAEIRAKEEAEEFKAKIKEEMTQKRWMVLVAFGSRQSVLLSKLEEYREQRKQKSLESAAATRIQRKWRLHHQHMLTVRRKWNIALVQRTLRRYIYKFRMRRKNKAAEIIKAVLRDMTQITLLGQAVKRMRYQVIQSQAMYRNYVEVFRAQCQLLNLQWLRVEQEMEDTSTIPKRPNIPMSHRKMALIRGRDYQGVSERWKKSNAVLVASTDRASARTSGRNSPLGGSDNENSDSENKRGDESNKVALHIRMRIIKDNLRWRRKEFMATQNQPHQTPWYKQDSKPARSSKMTGIHDVYERSSSPSVAPTLSTLDDEDPLFFHVREELPVAKPIFEVLLPKEEMIKLINQGIEQQEKELKSDEDKKNKNKKKDGTPPRTSYARTSVVERPSPNKSPNPEKGKEKVKEKEKEKVENNSAKNKPSSSSPNNNKDVKK
eukprot:TRINITY_DN6749_c0_g1_i2.p1 TRINITY_DN6749_c0_g1~~TRINITY_DN6749_c0_g1_i2.p1  ORF type:complete len:673 (+),score=146.05 TRINITY_DN6749_c0_g1_i2:127-2145(+)